MTIRNLDSLFKPASIALIGASNKASSVGAVLASNLYKGGFNGPIMPVNPGHRFINGVWAYPDIASLPTTPDLAIIATPPHTIAAIITELGQRGTRAAVIITAGFGEASQQGKALQQTVLDAAKPWLLRIIGPNCLGILVPGIGLNASFAHIKPKPGKLAFVTQSGAIVTSILDWAQTRGIGFSHMISLGDMADVDFGDMLDYLANQNDTEAILLYIESISHARKFMSAARAAARTKPVIVVKAGRHAEGARAAASHTGALAGNDQVFDAAFRRAGMLRVYSLEELFDAAETLSMDFKPHGDRLAIVTNGGGIGVLAADAVVDEGATLATLSTETIAELNTVLPPTWSHSNPVDIIGDAPGSRYASALEALSKDKNVDAILALNCPTAVTSSTDAAKAVIATATEQALLTSWVGGTAVAQARSLFADKRIPTYDTPEQAVRAFMYRVNYHRNQQTLIETPASVPERFSPDTSSVRNIIQQALAENRTWLNEPEAKQVLEMYAIPVATTHLAKTPDEAAAIAAEMGGAVALKIVSPDILHKSDAGGVILDLKTPIAVLNAAEAMLVKISQTHPDAQLTGFSVQTMIKRPDAWELIVGVNDDPHFGPAILFGQGGTAVEILNDSALTLPPLNMKLAHDLISHTQIYKRLKGYRGTPAADLDAIALVLIKIAQLVIDIPELKELDINPLLADKHGVSALDARIKISSTAGTDQSTDRLAICPYPKVLEKQISLRNGSSLLLRPVLPEDEPALLAAFKHLPPEESHLPPLISADTLNHLTAVRLTQIDYDREMSLILTKAGEAGIADKTEIYGLVSLKADPNNERAKFTVVIRPDMTSLGLGTILTQHIINYARERGLKELYSDVMTENQTIRKLCAKLSFTEVEQSEGSSLTRLILKF